MKLKFVKSLVWAIFTGLPERLLFSAFMILMVLGVFILFLELLVALSAGLTFSGWLQADLSAANHIIPR